MISATCFASAFQTVDEITVHHRKFGLRRDCPLEEIATGPPLARQRDGNQLRYFVPELRLQQTPQLLDVVRFSVRLFEMLIMRGGSPLGKDESHAASADGRSQHPDR